MKHSHMIYEILLFVRGSAKFTIENKKFVLNPGDLLLIPPGQYHNIDPNPDVPYERYIIKFPQYDIPQKLLSDIKTKVGSYKTANTVIPSLFARLDAHAENYRGVDLCGLLQCVLWEILYYSCNESVSCAFEICDEKMIGIINYINENIAKKIGLSEICKHFHYSKSHVCKAFRDCMSTPIMQYVRTKKILLAQSLIKTGKRPVEIYEQCGFSDYSTFFRAYKSILKTSPSER